MHRQFNSFKLISLLILSSGLVACAQSLKRYSYPLAPQQQIVWPEKPAQPRIKYIGAFSSAEDLNIEKGFFTLLAEVFVGSQEQRLIRPTAVLARGESEIFVADPGIKGIHYFNLEEENYKQIRLSGDLALPSPVALTLDHRQRVLVSDSALAKVFSVNVQAGIVEPVFLQSTLQQPTGLAFDQLNKRLYVVDTASHQVKIFDANGKLLKSFGQRGNQNAEFNYPTYIWHDSKQGLWVTDSLNYRVQQFDRMGKYLSQFGKAGQESGYFSRPKGVATDKFGHIYIVDALFHALQIFDNKGQLLLNIGQQGEKEAEFWLPTGVYIGENSRVFVADSHNQRVQVFEYIGNRK